VDLDRLKLDAAEVTNQVLADDRRWPPGLAADNRRERRSLDLVGLLVDNARENPVAVGHNLARTDNQREFKSVQLGLAEMALGDAERHNRCTVIVGHRPLWVRIDAWTEIVAVAALHVFTVQ